jgi:arginyl-tRNA synthetase
MDKTQNIYKYLQKKIELQVQSSIFLLLQKHGINDTTTCSKQGVETDMPSVSVMPLLWEHPPEFSWGQWALPVFAWAKILRKKPDHIATEFVEIWDSLNLPNNTAHTNNTHNARDNVVDRIEAKGAYINFHMDWEACSHIAITAIKTVKPKKIVLEYSQPNTHKPLHIGHLRGLFIGDALAKTHEYQGNSVIKTTYPGDLGTHIAKVLWFLIYKQNIVNKILWENQYANLEKFDTLYSEANKAYQSVPDADKQALHALFAVIIQDIQKKMGWYWELWEITRQISLQAMRNLYSWTNTQFDAWFYESSMEQDSLDLCHDLYKQGILVLDQGAIGCDLRQHPKTQSLGFAILIKQNGQGLYLTKDLALLKAKYEAYQYDESYYIVDYRQKLNFQQLFAIGEKINPLWTNTAYHWDYETVLTESGESFSSRQLNGQTLLSFLQSLEKHIATEYLSKYVSLWSPEKLEKTAKVLAVGCLKYGMLRIDKNQPVKFNAVQWLHIEGDTGANILYVLARALRLVNIYGSTLETTIEPIVEIHNKYTKSIQWLPAEAELLWQCIMWHQNLEQYIIEYKFHAICQNLFVITKAFNRFYEQCSLKDPETLLRRFTLVQRTIHILQTGLTLLNIEWLDAL